MKNTLFPLLIIALIPLFVFSNDLNPNTIPVSNTTITTSTQRDIGTYDPIRNTRWGTDVQIHSGDVRAISYSYDKNTFNMFSLVVTRHYGSTDTAFVYKSTDFGSSWYKWYTYLMPTSKIRDAKLLVADDISNPMVVLVDLFNNVGSDSSGDLYIQTILESDSTSVSWHSLSAGTVDTVYYANAAYKDSLIYIAYCAKDTAIGSSTYILAAVYNINNSSYQNKQSLFSDPVIGKPAIAAGGNGNVYVALLEDRVHTDTMNVRLKKSTNSGVSWLGTVSVSNNSLNYPLGNVSIAATPDSVVWVGVDYNLGSDYNWGYYYSTNSGQTFTYSGVYYTTDHSSWDQHLGTMDISKSGSFVTVAFKEDSTNSQHNVVFGWIQPSEPYHFYNDTLQVINDYDATNTLSPVACTKITHSGSYYLENSAVLYAGWGPTNVYFDGYNFTGVKEKVSNEKTTEFAISSTSISRNNVDIKLTLGKTANVNAAIYRLNGQKIKTLVSGERMSGVYNLRWNRRDNNNNRVSSGIYLLRVSANNNVKTAKIALIK